MAAAADWLSVRRGAAPFVVSLPHTGTDLGPLEGRFVSPWLARKDADWHVETLYDFAAGYDATIVRTALSRSMIDVNRDPSGVSLYPGQATTELCPSTTFDGEPLYRPGDAPDASEIEERKRLWFAPYQEALRAEINRLRSRFPRAVLYDCHSIRSVIPRLFEGELPVFNLGANSGASADAGRVRKVASTLAACGESYVVDGRFKGGWITRDFGRPESGVHALQMELACRAYLIEPDEVGETNWPAPLDADRAARTRDTLREIFDAIAAFSTSSPLGSGLEPMRKPSLLKRQ
jgi:N-formylglutamate deformylase